MKIITWNCNGAFRKKYGHLAAFDADILVIQECEDPSVSKDHEYIRWSQNYLWIGDSKNKGLGVFAKSTIKLERLDWSNLYNGHEVKHFLPCRINSNFNLLAVWTHRNNSPNFGYIGQLWKYLQINANLFNEIIVIGDLNSNSRWDQWDRWWNHTDVVNQLSNLGIRSIYHEYSNEKQGQESEFTLYLHRNRDKPYHIDYCFADKRGFNNVSELNIGKFDDWISLSDHMPVTINFESAAYENI